MVVEPPGEGAGYWVGAPSAAVADDGTDWLAYRLRRPTRRASATTRPHSTATDEHRRTGWTMGGVPWRHVRSVGPAWGRVADVIRHGSEWWAYYDGRADQESNAEEHTGMAVGDSPDRLLAGPERFGAGADGMGSLRYVSALSLPTAGSGWTGQPVRCLDRSPATRGPGPRRPTPDRRSRGWRWPIGRSVHSTTTVATAAPREAVRTRPDIDRCSTGCQRGRVRATAAGTASTAKATAQGRDPALAMTPNHRYPSRTLTAASRARPGARNRAGRRGRGEPDRASRRGRRPGVGAGCRRRLGPRGGPRTARRGAAWVDLSL